MSVMGVGSADYHEHSVAGRADDPVTAAAAYYASRGETPMIWGGTGRFELGVDGEVQMDHWRAVFGEGGARDPVSGDRLVGCRRPGLELVVSPPKSVAELGVIGRAEDMHAIVDAERDATMAYLDRLVCEQGGRRGRAALRCGTGGLVWATARHTTTRAGDPQVHDHVLVANVVSMRDPQGGWKALDTAFVRDHLHAATAVGRLAAAAKAVELGYGIEADRGPSGRLGGWAIAGIPRQAWEIHATRSGQIEASVGVEASYRARAVAARATRDRKTREPVGDLIGRWQNELAAAGYPVAELLAGMERAALEYQAPDVSILDGLAERLLSPGGRLAETNTFTRDQVVVAVAPVLHGLPVSMLDTVVEQVLASELAVALPAVGCVREPVWAAGCVLDDERRIAHTVDRLAAGPGPQITTEKADAAIRAVEVERGVRFTDDQRSVAVGLLTGGHRLDVVVGVAGAGKTTTLSAVAAGYVQAGYRVLGAATSGQGARNLGEGTGIDSATVASLSWQIDQDRLTLTARDVIILDEAAMTSDTDLSGLLGAVERAGAKLIAVGDYRQLDPVGPGGALEAITRSHPELTWTLATNLRQIDPGERQALNHLRAGDVHSAVGWYSRNGRIHPAADKNIAITNMARRWAHDVAAGRDTVLLAYRRANVEALNQAARQQWDRLGHLHGPEFVAGDGRRYRAGDRIIALAPGPDRAWTTSQTMTVTAVDPGTGSLTARLNNGHHVRVDREWLDDSRIGHGYAMTVHRTQGATVDVAHVLADGGGRELAYVAMSRARHASHLHIATSDVFPAQRIEWEWTAERRQAWALDPQVHLDALLNARQERQRLARQVPPDRRSELDHAYKRQTAHQHDLDQLRRGV